MARSVHTHSRWPQRLFAALMLIGGLLVLTPTLYTHLTQQRARRTVSAYRGTSRQLTAATAKLRAYNLDRRPPCR